MQREPVAPAQRRRHHGRAPDRRGPTATTTASTGWSPPPTAPQYWFGEPVPGSATPTPDRAGVRQPHRRAVPRQRVQRLRLHQAWRWNLDYVVDPHGNTMSLLVRQGDQQVRRATTPRPTGRSTTAAATWTHRLRHPHRRARGSAPMRVVFASATGACPSCATHDAAHWPDTPWDQECTADTVRPDQQRRRSGPPSGWHGHHAGLGRIGLPRRGAVDVDPLVPRPGRQHHGRAVAGPDHPHRPGRRRPRPLPDVTFAGVADAQPGRHANDHSPAMNWCRIKTITTETGGKIDVTYSGAGLRRRHPDARPGQPAQQHAALLPGQWTPAGLPDPITDCFHKYVVTDVVETDLAGTVVAGCITHYDYLGDAGLALHRRRRAHQDATTRPGRCGAATRAVQTTKGDPGEQTRDRDPVLPRHARRQAAHRHPQRAAAGDRLGGVPAVERRGRVRRHGPRDDHLQRPERRRGLAPPSSEPWQSAPTRQPHHQRRHRARPVHVGTAAEHTRTALDGGRG